MHRARELLTKIGLHGHDRGSSTASPYLRDERKAACGPPTVAGAIERLRSTARAEGRNLYAAVVETVGTNLTHGEIVAVLQEKPGTGGPVLII